ncbi:protein phosphatase 1 regulatory subunit 12A-like [Sycon ciliatum]|uniref:protein phosphatase 1 regulatory subunit 12A-like n=1 Tax=Sycon ciliatum TaxID=27933 RepID=UPI0031F5FB34
MAQVGVLSSGRSRSMSLPNANRSAGRQQRVRRVSFPQEICFHEAVKTGDLREVHILLVDGGFDKNSLSQSGISALHQCCLDGRLALVTALVTAGADVHKRDVDGWQPIHAASAMGNTEIVEFLLEHGAKPDALTPQNETPADLTEESDVSTRRVLAEYVRKLGTRASFASADSGLAMGEDSGDEDNLAKIAPSTILSKIEKDKCEEDTERVITWPLRHNSVHSEMPSRHAVATRPTDGSRAGKRLDRITSQPGSEERLPSYTEAKALTPAMRFSAVEISPTSSTRVSGVVTATSTVQRGTAAMIKEAREGRKKSQFDDTPALSSARIPKATKRLSDFAEEIFV